VSEWNQEAFVVVDALLKPSADADGTDSGIPSVNFIPRKKFFFRLKRFTIFHHSRPKETLRRQIDCQAGEVANGGKL